MSRLLLSLFAFGTGCLMAQTADTLTVLAGDAPALSKTAQSELRDELSRLLRPVGLELDLRSLSSRTSGEDFNRLIVTKFRGTCSAEPLPSGSLSEGRSLASTAVSDGKVLPFSTVECDTLRRWMSGALATTRKSQRDEVFGRAIARVLAHEIYHILTGTTGHNREGVSKSCFSVADLTSEDFRFDNTTLAQMRPAAGSEFSGSFPTEDASDAGR